MILSSKSPFVLGLFISLSLAFSACRHNSIQGPMKQIAELHEQLDKDSISIDLLEKEVLPPLERDFLFCDSMLAFLSSDSVEAHFEALRLCNSYIVQFKEVVPVMKRSISYSRHQLDNLALDIKDSMLTDSLVQIYIDDETKAADTTHHRVIYFQERLNEQQIEIANRKKAMLEPQ